MSSERTNGPQERRTSKRFSVECTVRYCVLGQNPVEVSGSGKTVNVSTGGMLIAINRVLSPGMLVEVEVDWRANPDDRVSLNLVAMCEVVRSESGAVPLAAVEITSHAFHITGD